MLTRITNRRFSRKFDQSGYISETLCVIPITGYFLETILVFILTASYVLLFLYLTMGVLRAKRVQGVPAKPSVSIIVPLHNE